MIETDERRKKIVQVLKGSKTAINGTKLAEIFDVSRQVIVQDIAILKAENNEIISTNRGYKILFSDEVSRDIKVSHDDKDIETELNAAVDLGAEVRNVFIWHRAYGKIVVPLEIKSRKDTKRFIDEIESGISKPLKGLTGGYHYHTVVAESEEVLDEVEDAWRELGFLSK